MSQTDTMKRLTKSRSNRVIDGVCGGVAEYFAVDPTLMRILWVLLALFGGSGILLYILCMILMPVNPSFSPSTATVSQSSAGSHAVLGGLLVVVGALWLLSNLDIVPWHRWWGFWMDVFIPGVLIVAGAALIAGKRIARSSPQAGAATPADSIAAPARSPLFRSRTDRKLFGVCGGLGEYFRIDPTLLRILFVFAALASFGIVVLAYVLLAIFVPHEPAPAGVARGT